MGSAFKYYFIVVAIFFIVFSGFMIWFFQTDMIAPEGYQFCQSKGYEGTSLFGSYNQMYSKVSCVSCYGGECIYQEFNVTKRFGIIVEVKN
jgi:hypothetical protein